MGQPDDINEVWDGVREELKVGMEETAELSVSLHTRQTRLARDFSKRSQNRSYFATRAGKLQRA